MKKFITALLTVDQITRIESEFYDPKLLLQIYQAL